MEEVPVSYNRVRILRDQADAATQSYLLRFGWRKYDSGDQWFRYIDGFSTTVSVPSDTAIDLTRNILDRNVGTE